MNTYHVKKISGSPDISDSVWKDANAASIDVFPWDEDGYKPRTVARALYSEEGITVKMETDEKPLLARYTDDHSPVCTDSCMEFFFSANQNDKRYFNFEFNPNGALLIGFGGGRDDSARVEFDKRIFKIETVIGDTWQLKFFIPFSFIKEYVGEITEKFSGNFYKCGDETVHPHWGCWNEVKAPEPDFHRPEYFGEIILTF